MRGLVDESGANIWTLVVVKLVSHMLLERDLKIKNKQKTLKLINCIVLISFFFCNPKNIQNQKPNVCGTDWGLCADNLRLFLYGVDACVTLTAITPRWSPRLFCFEIYSGASSLSQIPEHIVKVIFLCFYIGKNRIATKSGRKVGGSAQLL